METVSLMPLNCRKSVLMGVGLCVSLIPVILWGPAAWTYATNRSPDEVVITVNGVEVDWQQWLRFNFAYEQWRSSGSIQVVHVEGNRESPENYNVEKRPWWNSNTVSMQSYAQVERVEFLVKEGDILRLRKGESMTIAKGTRRDDIPALRKYQLILRFD